MKKIFFFMLTLVAAMLGSCVSDEEVRIMPEFSYSDNEVMIGRAVGSSYMAPIATTEQVVTAEYDCEWLSVEVNTRHALFTALTENDGEENRTTEVILRAGDFMETVTVTQQCLEIPDNALVVGQQTEDGLGMIFWVDPENPTVGKAISLQRLEGKAFESAPTFHGATSLIDGKANTALYAEHTAEDAAGSA
ncbi:MAG: BACON domain-containing protein [Alistipes sp.]|nr:BACON domain-containing protein [Alistipes sp.]